MKPTVIAVLAGVIIIGGALFFAGKGGVNPAAAQGSNVSVSDGKQIIEIGVKGGYAPQLSSAKAGMPTVLRMKTNGTFDCSSGVVIPSLGIRQTLPATASTDIEIPPQKAGSTVQGLCVMAMYHFAVNFN